MKRLHQIDANLLVALDVLLEERHVTRAAARLGVTQSAMSQTLARLRDALGDPLLVRNGKRMTPTPRAESLRAPLHAALRALEETLQTAPGFDPATTQHAFHMACLDIYGVTLVPRLVQAVAAAGPGLELHVQPLDVDHVWTQLREGDIALALTGPRPIPSDMHTAHFLHESMLGLVRQDHPILRAPVTPESYTRWPHAAFRITGRGDHPIDRKLAALGLARRVVSTSPYFLSAPALVAHSDLIVTVPRSVALASTAHWPVATFAPPLGPGSFDVSMVWPGYLDADPAHRWLRAQIAQIGRDLAAEAASAAPAHDGDTAR